MHRLRSNGEEKNEGATDRASSGMAVKMVCLCVSTTNLLKYSPVQTKIVFIGMLIIMFLLIHFSLARVVLKEWLQTTAL